MATLQTGTAPNQIPTNGDLGDLAFQSKESVQFTGGRGALSSINLNQIYKEIAVTAVDVFVYDTSKDSDGGAWRRRTQHTSWYNETLNTATRGSRREFPSVAVIVATTTSVTIYDGDDPAMPMWMVFQRGLGYPGWTHLVGGNHASDQISCVSASNAIIVTGLGNGPNVTAWAGLYYCNFLLDAGYKTNSSGSYTYNGWFNFPISQRYYSYANDSQFSTKTVPFLVNSFVNDVAMTVLANAPIDAATGLPIPTIAVATASGVNIIKHDNTVINLLTTSGNQNSISFTASKGLETHGGGGVAYFGWGWYSMPQASTNTSDYLISDNAWSTTNIRRPGGGGNSVLYPMTTTNYGIAIRESAGVTTTDKLILIALTNPAGYSLQSYLTTKYNTGWMPGDIRGAWLSDNTAETVVGEKLSSNTFYNTGWTTSGAGDFVINANGTVTVTGTGNKTESYLQSPTFTTTVGKTYVISVRTSSASGTGIGIYAYGTGGPNAYVWDRDFVFVSTASSTNFFLYRFGGHTGSATITSISVKEADLDRSVNKNPLQVFGSITKTPVATGADLVAYSGTTAFGPSYSYFYAPYLPAIGTGDFSISLWIKPTASGGTYFHMFSIGGGQNSTDGFTFKSWNSTAFNPYFYSNSGDMGSYSASLTAPLGNWHHVIAGRQAGYFKIYINGNLMLTSGSVNSNNFTATRGYIGRDESTQETNSSSISMVRFSFIFPSAEQIAKMYNDEKYLFQDNAKATLYGTSDSVTALAYDEDTQLLHAGTSSGRSVFRGLCRVDNTTTAVDAAISAANGLVAED